MLRYLLGGVLLLALFACDKQRVYEKNIDLAGNQWYIDTVPSFTFHIEDPSITYTLSYNIRNALSYPNYNLFVRYYLQDSTGKTLSSGLQELMLVDAKTGKPLGDGLGDIFDHQIISLKNYRFPHKGPFTFRVKQYMRQDPLPSIMSVGVRVEKTQ
ncbi:MAG: gliding motility lipoprotein GldH [Bacteroidota bacterium]